MDKDILEVLGRVLDEKLAPIKSELQKNSVLLENLNRKIEVVAEV